MSHSRILSAAWFFLLLSLAAPLAAGDPKPAAPRWFKGNLHTHSLWSDGNDFPEMICDWYAKNGYHFLALSDHNILSRHEKWIDVDEVARRGATGGLERYRRRFGDTWVETRTVDAKRQVRLKTLDEFRVLLEKPGVFRMIQAEEITDEFGSFPIHVNASNLYELIPPQGGSTVRETIANNLIAVQEQSRRLGQPMLAHLNHPNFGYAVTAEDMAAVVQEKFFEVYNGHPDVHHQGDHHHVSVERMWDIANTLRIAEMKQPPLFGMATDDSHNYFGESGASPGRGWVMVEATELTPKSLIEAIKRGRFYATSGVRLNDIRYDREAKTLTINVTTEPGANYVTEIVGTLRDYNRQSEPIVDQRGQPIHATRKYSADVGKVLATIEGPRAVYKLTGQELYVRAVITSSRPPANPSFEGQRQQAWTQPVGWRALVSD